MKNISAIALPQAFHENKNILNYFRELLCFVNIKLRATCRDAKCKMVCCAQHVVLQGVNITCCVQHVVLQGVKTICCVQHVVLQGATSNVAHNMSFCRLQLQMLRATCFYVKINCN
jgi:hypothetical protein